MIALAIVVAMPVNSPPKTTIATTGMTKMRAMVVELTCERRGNSKALHATGTTNPMLKPRRRPLITVFSHQFGRLGTLR